MTARYVLTAQAREDLTELAEYIAQEGGLGAAEHVLEKFRETFRFLAENPGAGHVREELSAGRP
jgi:plasmid stabilization system protein ParE